LSPDLIVPVGVAAAVKVDAGQLLGSVPGRDSESSERPVISESRDAANPIAFQREQNDAARPPDMQRAARIGRDPHSPAAFCQVDPGDRR
jgi:hypothetical protein